MDVVSAQQEFDVRFLMGVVTIGPHVHSRFVPPKGFGCSRQSFIDSKGSAVVGQPVFVARRNLCGSQAAHNYLREISDGGRQRWRRSPYDKSHAKDIAGQATILLPLILLVSQSSFLRGRA